MAAGAKPHQYDVVILLDLLHKFFQPFLELATILGARHQETHVECDHLHQQF